MTLAPRAVGLVVAALVFALDQGLKFYVADVLSLATVGRIELLPIFNLTWVENRGVSLGLLTFEGEPGRWLLTLLTGLIAVGVLVWLWRERARQDAIALGLVLGGALGNILDRVRFGHVVDYADLHLGAWRPFLVFNLADAAITVGVLILFIRALLAPRKAAKHA